VVTCLRVLSVSWLCPPWRPGGVSAVVITGAVVLPAVASAPGVSVRMVTAKVCEHDGVKFVQGKCGSLLEPRRHPRAHVRGSTQGRRSPR